MKQFLLYFLMGVGVLCSGSVSASADSRLVAKWKKEVAKNPDNPQARYQLVQLYCQMDSVQPALREYKMLLELDSTLSNEPQVRMKIGLFLGLEPFAVTRLTPNIPGGAILPTFSADSKRVAFQSGLTGKYQIYVVDITTDSILPVTRDTFMNIQPFFAPDGKSVLFASFRDSSWGVYSIAANGENLETVIRDTIQYQSPRLSPDGRTLAVQYYAFANGNYEIGVINLADKTITQLTDNIYWDGEPAFSPDGKKILFHSSRDLHFEVYIMDRDGKNQRRLTQSQGNSGKAWFNPEGTKVIFSSDRSGRSQLYLLDPMSGSLTQLTMSNGENDYPCFSPDGRWLTFQSTRNEGYEICLMDLTAPVPREVLAKRLKDL